MNEHLVLSISENNSLQFPLEQLEEWKDRIAEWWGREKLRYEHKRMVELFRLWFGVSKERAVALEFNSREIPERFIEEFLDLLARQFNKKLHDKPIDRINVDLSFKNGAFATVLFQGEEFEHDVPGHAGIVGTVHYVDGTKQTVFQRFISHPFWQHSHQSSLLPVSAQ